MRTFKKTEVILSYGQISLNTVIFLSCVVCVFPWPSKHIDKHKTVESSEKELSWSFKTSVMAFPGNERLPTTNPCKTTIHVGLLLIIVIASWN